MHFLSPKEKRKRWRVSTERRLCAIPERPFTYTLKVQKPYLNGERPNCYLSLGIQIRGWTHCIAFSTYVMAFSVSSGQYVQSWTTCATQLHLGGDANQSKRRVVLARPESIPKRQGRVAKANVIRVSAVVGRASGSPGGWEERR
jgi:hypothetical protein